MSELDLFGEPTRDPGLSQFFTAKWLANRMAAWIPRGASVLEPSCGRGNLIKAALDRGASSVFACDISRHWVDFCLDRFRDDPRVTVVRADFLELVRGDQPLADVALMNPPYENDQTAAHVEHAVALCSGGAIALVHSDLEYSNERDAFWRGHEVVRRAMIVDRPFPNAARNYMVAYVMTAGTPGPVRYVMEERWRKESR